MVPARRALAMLGAMVMVLGACGPAATATPVPATPTPRAATATPQRPPPGGSATPQPTSTPAPTAVAAAPKYGGTLKKNVLGEPRLFDPYLSGLSDLQDVVGFAHSRLIRFNPGPPECSPYPLQPDLAMSWQWLDDLTLEVKLRQGAKFPAGPPYNGREFTSEDVVYSMTRQWPKQTGFQAVAILALIAGVEARDRYTVRVRLTTPLTLFTEKALAGPLMWIMGPEPFRLGGDPEKIEKLEENIGLGPFLLTSYIPGVKVVYGKNPGWYMAGLPYLDGLELLIMPDVSTQTAAMRAGKLDFAFFRTSATAGLELEKTTPHLNTAWCPFPSPVAIHMRLDKKDLPFRDIRVRRAISMALDREAILKAVFHGKGSIAPTAMPPYFTYYFLPPDQYPPEVRQYSAYNPAQAKKLLAEAGYPGGFETSMVFTRHFIEQAQMFEAISALLREAGIRIKGVLLEYADFSRVAYGAIYEEMSLSYTHGGEDPDTALWDVNYSGGGKFVGKGRNRGYVDDPKLDQMLERARLAKGDEERKQMYRDIQVYLGEQQYMILTAVPSLPTVWQPWVKGVVAKAFTKAEVSDLLYIAWLDK